MPMLAGFFDTEGFMPHGVCLLWQPVVLWLQLVSDAVIALAYYSIPLVLIQFARRRRDLAFPWVFYLFGAFIFAGGTTHVMGIWTLWNPDYGVEGLIKAATAAVSIVTAGLLWPSMRRALALPSPAMLAPVDRDLHQQIHEQRKAEAAVRRMNEDLGRRVQERTGQLEAANSRLQTEIAERRQVEERLRASEGQYREVVELIRESIWIHSDGRIVFANPHAATMFGLDRVDDLIGRPFMDLVHPDDRAAAIARTKVLTEGRRPVPLVEMKLLRADGRHVMAEIQGVPCTYQGRPSVLGVARDITERKEAEIQLRQSQKLEAIGQLTGGIAHDFNNLLTVVLGNLETVIERLGADQPDLRKLCTEAMAAAERGAALTRRLLAFGRRQTLEPRETDIAATISGMSDLLRRTLGEHIEIETGMPGDLWPAVVDRGQLENALLNLAINSRDAMPEGGKLTIEAANAHLDSDYAAGNAEVLPGDYVMLAVSDTGTGMTPEVMEQAIQPFFTTKEVGKGSGLGLSMIYGFAKQSGGHFKLYSEVGLGTTAKLYLPRAGAMEPAKPALAAQPAEPPTGHETILVVEDEPAVRDLVVRQLSELGYKVVAAENGPAALRVIDAGHPVDLLMTDIVMPGGLTGWQLAAYCRQLRPGLKAVFTSGYAENSVSHVTEAPGKDVKILSKPYTKAVLGMTVREALDRPE